MYLEVHIQQLRELTDTKLLLVAVVEELVDTEPQVE